MPHTKLHDAIADYMAEAELSVERNISGRAEAIVTLLREPEERDEDIWRSAFSAAEEAGAPLDEDDWDIDVDDLADVPMSSRDFRWSSVIQTAISAAQAQFDAENILLDLWGALEGAGSAVVGAVADVPRPFSEDAKRGPSREKMKAAKEKKRGEK